MSHHDPGRLDGAFTGLNGGHPPAHEGFDRRLQLLIFADLPEITPGDDPHQLALIHDRQSGATPLAQNPGHFGHGRIRRHRKNRKGHEIADLHRGLLIALDKVDNHLLGNDGIDPLEHGTAGTGVASAAQAFHQRAHVQPVMIATADHHAFLPTFLIGAHEQAEGGIDIDDIPVHANDQGQIAHMAVDIDAAETDRVAIDFHPVGVLEHFEKHLFLLFAICRTQKFGHQG